MPCADSSLYNRQLPIFKQECRLSYTDLREWIAAFDRAGELKSINAEADPVLEITEIADRVSKRAAKNIGVQAVRRCCLKT